MLKKLFRSSHIILSLFLVAGCAAAIGTVGTANRVANTATKDGATYMDQSHHPMPPAHISTVKVSDDIWTTGSARRSDHGNPLPREWEREKSFVLKSATPLHLYEIGTEITSITRIPIIFAPDVFETTANGGQRQPQTQAAPSSSNPPTSNSGGATGGNVPSAPPPPDINTMLSSMGLAGGNGATNQTTPQSNMSSGGNTAGAQGNTIHPIPNSKDAMKVDFQGRLSEFLNQMSAHFSVNWEYSNGEIRIFKNVTRTYTVHALPFSVGLESTMSAQSSSQETGGGTGGSGTGGTTTGSNQTVDAKINIEIWKDISGAVNAIVGNYGYVTTAISTGTITVTAPPPIIARVQDYLEGQNERLKKQIAVSVQVLNLQISDTDSYGFDLQAIFQKAGNFGFSFGDLGGAISSIAGTAAGSATNAYSGMASSINSAGTPGGSGASFGIVSPTSGWRGTNGVIQALSTAGRLTVRTTASVTTLNGIPAPLQVANTRGYVSNIMVTAFPSFGAGSPTSETQLTTSTVTTGFSLSILPRINADSTGILMQFGISLSDLNGPDGGFNNYTTPDGTETVQLPNIDSRNFVQQAFVPNGSTLVLAGFEQQTNDQNSTGVGSAAFMGLGGSQQGTATRVILVILMTPVVLSNSVPLVTTD